MGGRYWGPRVTGWRGHLSSPQPRGAEVGIAVLPMQASMALQAEHHMASVVFLGTVATGQCRDTFTQWTAISRCLPSCISCCWSGRVLGLHPDSLSDGLHLKGESLPCQSPREVLVSIGHITLIRAVFRGVSLRGQSKGFLFFVFVQRMESSVILFSFSPTSCL